MARAQATSPSRVVIAGGILLRVNAVMPVKSIVRDYYTHLTRFENPRVRGSNPRPGIFKAKRTPNRLVEGLFCDYRQNGFNVA